jgi:MFS-type transporter involved in bile tolerance (Atg22 family)
VLTRSSKLVVVPSLPVPVAGLALAFAAAAAALVTPLLVLVLLVRIDFRRPRRISGILLLVFEITKTSAFFFIAPHDRSSFLG